MRLYLLPISTRRTLLYCQRLEVANSGKQTWSERIQGKAAKTWATWEAKEKGWQKTVVNYGNYALRRIPYAEWGLKSVPPLSERRKIQELNGSDKVEVVYPKTLIPTDRVHGVLKILATEREALHRKKLIWCLVGMPITAPVALIPVYVILGAISCRRCSLCYGSLIILQSTQYPVLLPCLPRLVPLASDKRRKAHPIPPREESAGTQSLCRPGRSLRRPKATPAIHARTHHPTRIRSVRQPQPHTTACDRRIPRW